MIALYGVGRSLQLFRQRFVPMPAVLVSAVSVAPFPLSSKGLEAGGQQVALVAVRAFGREGFDDHFTPVRSARPPYAPSGAAS